MNKANLRSVDLNLLVVLDALMEEKHITNAAKRLNLSQSAMSKSFARIRDTFDDPILIRLPTGYGLTYRAQKLVQPVKQILQEIQQVVEPQKFNPLLAKETFTICSLDYVEMMVGTSFMKRIIEKSPNSQVLFVPRSIENIEELQTGKVDLLFGAIQDKYKRQSITEPLYQDRLVCVVDRFHPLAEKNITLDDYLSYPHAVIHSGMDNLFVETILSARQLKRQIVKKSASFVGSVLSLKGTPMILTIPRSTVLPLIEFSDFVMHEMPIDLPTLTVDMIWHKRNEHNVAHKWFREEFKSLVLDLNPEKIA